MRSKREHELRVLRKLLVFIVLMLGVESFAGTQNLRCQSLLLDGFNEDSKSFQVKEADFVNNIDFGKDYVRRAFFLVRELLKSEGCNISKLKFNKGFSGNSENHCRKIHPEVEESRVCFIQSNIGYFFLMDDLLGHTNITYNRWD